MVELEFRLEGYSSLRATLGELNADAATFVLSRVPDLDEEVDGPVRVPAGFSGDFVVIGSASGEIVCLDVARGKPSWRWRIPGNTIHSLCVPPLVCEDGVYTGWSGGQIIRFTPLRPSETTARGEGQVQTDVVSVGGIPSTPLRLGGGGALLALGTTGGDVLIYDRATLSLRAQIPVAGKPSSLERISDSELLVGTLAGGLFRADLRTRTVSRLTADTGDPVLEAEISRGLIAARTKGDRIILRRIDDSPSPGGVPTTVPASRSAAFAQGAGKALSLEEGGVIRVLDLSTQSSGTEITRFCANRLVGLPGAVCLLDERDRSLFVLGAGDMSPRWAARTDTDITMVAGGATHVAVGVATQGEDGRTRCRVLVFRDGLR
jgi:hypothetical protein